MKLLSVVFLLLGCGWMLSCAQKTEVSFSGKAVFTVSYPYGYHNKAEKVYLNLSDLKKNYDLSDFSNIQLVDMTNHKPLPFQLYDLNKDNTADLLCFKIKIDPEEPLLAFQFEATDKRIEHLVKPLNEYTNKLNIQYLQTANQYLTDTINWSKTIANTFIELYPDACKLEVFTPNKWSYTNGFYTNALCHFYELTNDKKYLDYAQNWINCFIDSTGIIDDYDQSKYRLDDILPGRTILYVNQYYPQKRYQTAIHNFVLHLTKQPKTSDGGYWHKKVYQNQMWLDGIYMGDVFTSQYASLFNEPEWFNEAIHQIKTIYKHTHDPKTGLLFHGWDESINKVWSDPVTGTSPEIWGRGLGWYMMALVDVLDYLPENHPERDDLISILNDLSTNLANYQDSATGLWYQVVNKGTEPDNWIETSCSAMYAYAFIKGAKKGYLSQDYREKAIKAFHGLKNGYLYFDHKGHVYLTETVKVGTLNFRDSDGSYKYYINVNRRVNDFKGVAALLYLTMELEY